MKLVSAFIYLRWVMVLIGILLFAFKCIDIQMFRKKQNRPMRFRAIGWYPSMEIISTSSNNRRQVMQRSNFITTIIWICLLLAAVLFIIPKA